MAEKTKLTPRQERFVAEYLIDLNGKQAAIRAGYKPKGAPAQAVRLLTNVNVKAAIEAKNSKRLEDLGISAEAVLKGLARLAYFDPRKFFNADGSLKSVTELDDDTAQALAGIEVEELFAGRGDNRKNIGRLTKIKLPDRGINLERLGKHLNLFRERVELTGKDGEGLSMTLRIISSNPDEEPAESATPSEAKMRSQT